MTDLLKFDFCEMHIFDDYVIVIIDEGITITPKHNKELINVVETYFRNTNFVYISHRLNSYAVDPATYLETSKIKNLKGFAVVSKDYKAKSNAQVEKLFLDKPLEIFDDLIKAVSWKDSILYD
ncbi:hypothetical protein [Gelidibacter maritimus]|uniref:STAS/SEC14 domain-containing protein n=1 Tax=Gelidibacter maritimus TaxID=2761487 RepID=A0A7W2R3A1_9FLAO|nr:hypothetical protein [Gelidibacter maritimus]MBA6152622.1 hypothetical protein [Gelidibacter maritimus]